MTSPLKHPITGNRYRVWMVVPGVWNIPRIMVADLIAYDGEIWTFSLRPEAGTSEVQYEHITRIQAVPSTTPIEVPHKPKRVKK